VDTGLPKRTCANWESAGVPVKRHDNGEYALWQRRFWEHTIRNEIDFERHVDYVHFNRFALTFYKDVAEIYDCLTRVRNVGRNPTGFSLDDAPILGLLVRIWKLLKEIIRYYEENNAEIIRVRTH
jgi:hypothetical protein